MKLFIPILACAALLSACGGGGSPRVSSAPAAPSYKSGSLLPPVAQSSARGLKAYKIRGVRYYPRDDIGYRQRGNASWYGPNFHGRLTANGERYNQNALTAAHKTLPLGSYVKVTNLENGRTLTLLINDRGPFVRGRIIDLSRRAAQLLDVIKKGTAPVIVERTDRYGRSLVRRNPVQQARVAAPVRRVPVEQPQRLPQLPVQQPAPVAQDVLGPVLVKVGAFSDFYNARRLQQTLADIGPTSVTQVTSSAGQILYRVHVGPFNDVQIAQNALADIHAKGHSAATLQGVKAYRNSSR